MVQAISTPQVTINNETISIVPNTLVYDAGEGEINVRAASGGGNNVITVHTANAETKMSKVTLELFLTSETDSQVQGWKRGIGANVISISQRLSNGTSVTRTFSNMSLMNAVERNATADGTVSLEFMGDPMSGA